MGQITKAWTPTGQLRFDALAEIRDKHKPLYELSWSNVYQRPDLQLRAVVLKMKDNYEYYKKYTKSDHALAFADAGYNGGIRGVDNERRACKLADNCDPAQWFDNVERFCLKGKAALYGQRSACDINRHHVRDVLLTREPKYGKYFSK